MTNSNDNKLRKKTLEILSRRKARKPELGAYISLTVGPTGSGKTSNLMFEAKNIIRWYPDELIFWRDSPETSAQFNRIGDNYQILAKNDCNIRFRHLIKGGNVDIPVIYFASFLGVNAKESGQFLVLMQVYFISTAQEKQFLKHVQCARRRQCRTPNDEIRKNVPAKKILEILYKYQ